MLGKVTSFFRGIGSSGSSSKASRTPMSPPSESSRSTAASSADGNPFSGARPDSSGAGPEALPPRDKDALAGYLMARAAMHRKIDDAPEIEWNADGSMDKRSDALKRLRAANETVEETHALLPYGRGNVTEDNRRTGYESSRRDEAAPHLFDENSHKGEPQHLWAAVFRFVKAARCGGSAPIATHLHAAKLEEPYRVSTVEGKRVDHTWTELTWKDARRQDDVIIDRWCEGPAVLREDARYGNADAKTIHQLDGTTGPEAAKTVERLTAGLEGDPRQQNLLNYYIGTGEFDHHSEGYKRYGAEFEPRSVFDPGFLKEAGKALRGESGHPSLEGKPGLSRLGQEIQAVGVALSLSGGLAPAYPDGEHAPAAPAPSGKIRDALMQAPGIIESAKRQFP